MIQILVRIALLLSFLVLHLYIHPRLLCARPLLCADLQIPIQHFQVLREATKKGLLEKHALEYKENDINFQLSIKAGAQLDIWPTYITCTNQKGREEFGLRFMHSGECGKLAPMEDVLHATRHVFSGVEVSVPQNTIDHLHSHYGPDCMDTVKVWNYDFHNENMDPQFSEHKEQYAIPISIFNKVMEEFQNTSAYRTLLDSTLVQIKGAVS
jgi:hypothetical protein